jgi:hypothetical protein
MKGNRETTEDAMLRNLKRIKTEGLDAATDAAFMLLRDPKAPAQAKSATINAIYRAAGLFSRDGDNDKAIEPHEMTPEQLARETQRLMRQLSAAEKGATDEDEETETGFSAFD